MSGGIEWVTPKEYDRFKWQPDLGDETGGSKKGKPGKARITLYGPEKKAKAAPIETPNEFGPTEKAPPKKNTPKAIGPGSRPHEGPAKPALPGGPSQRALPAGSRTVADEEVGRQARADLVKSVMDSKYSDRRQRGWDNMNTGAIHTGVVLSDTGVMGGRAPLALPSRQTASTDRLPKVESRAPFAMRTPIPVGSGRNPEQLALFHTPGEPVNPSLSTRQQSPIALSSGSRVSKLAARPTPGKKPGDQGVLFQPARYRSVR
jgi:hypothetical protein